MNAPVVTTYEEAQADPNAILWLAHPQWDDPHFFMPKMRELADRTAVYTSSWQHSALKPFVGQNGPRNLIIPKSIRPATFSFAPVSGPLEVIWRSSDSSSLTLLVSALNGIGATGDDVQLKIWGDPSPVTMPLLNKKRDTVVTDVTEESYERALETAHVFAFPSTGYVSQDHLTLQAASAGKICVVPHHSGFREMLGVFGAYVHHSFDNTQYAVALCQTLSKVFTALRSGDISSTSAEAQKWLVDSTFAPEVEDAMWHDVHQLLTY